VPYWANNRTWCAVGCIASRFNAFEQADPVEKKGAFEMSETNRLGPWGWFVRAFAAGLGAMCGVMAGSFVACIFYGLAVGGIWLLSSVSVQQTPSTATRLAPPPPSGQTYASPAYQSPPSTQHNGAYPGANPYASAAANSYQDAPTPFAAPASYAGSNSPGELEDDVQYFAPGTDFAASATHEEPTSDDQDDDEEESEEDASADDG
jgi:hypothetical protein